MPWICQFKVLTLLPLSEITVSCWVSISMGLLRKTSSSILAFASPIVLTETVICGGCPNFIFLANCCWKARKEKIKKRYLYYEQDKSGTCLFSTWKLHQNIQGNFWLWKRKKTSLSLPLLQHSDHPSSLYSKVTQVGNLLHDFWFWVINLSSHQCCQFLQTHCEIIF